MKQQTILHKMWFYSDIVIQSYLYINISDSEPELCRRKRSKTYLKELELKGYLVIVIFYSENYTSHPFSMYSIVYHWFHETLNNTVYRIPTQRS